VGTTEEKGLHKQALHHEQPQNIRQEFAAIPADMLQCVFANMEHHIQLCMSADGGLTSEPHVTGYSFTRTETSIYNYLTTISAQKQFFLAEILGPPVRESTCIINNESKTQEVCSFNIILPSTPRSPKWFFPLDFPLKFCLHLSTVQYMLHTLSISSSLF
jgi:hypothetical protein